jgi:hypothetical protein
MYAQAMVNTNVVNARTPCSERADFCVIFAVSGRFLHFKNPVKYIRRFEIHHVPSRTRAEELRSPSFLYMPDNDLFKIATFNDFSRRIC